MLRNRFLYFVFSILFSYFGLFCAFKGYSFNKGVDEIKNMASKISIKRFFEDIDKYKFNNDMPEMFYKISNLLKTIPSDISSDISSIESKNINEIRKFFIDLVGEKIEITENNQKVEYKNDNNILTRLKTEINGIDKNKIEYIKNNSKESIDNLYYSSQDRFLTEELNSSSSDSGLVVEASGGYDSNTNFDTGSSDKTNYKWYDVEEFIGVLKKQIENIINIVQDKKNDFEKKYNELLNKQNEAIQFTEADKQNLINKSVDRGVELGFQDNPNDMQSLTITSSQNDEKLKAQLGNDDAKKYQKQLLNTVAIFGQQNSQGEQIKNWGGLLNSSVSEEEKQKILKNIEENRASVEDMLRLQEETMQKTNEEFKLGIKKVTEKLSEIDKKAKEISDFMETIKKEKEEAQQKYEEIVIKVGVLSSGDQKLREELEQLLIKQKALDAENDTLNKTKVELEKNNREINNLLGQINGGNFDSSKAIDEINRINGELEKKKTEIEQKRKEAENKKIEVENKIKEQEKNNSELDKQKESINENIKNNLNTKQEEAEKNNLTVNSVLIAINQTAKNLEVKLSEGTQQQNNILKQSEEEIQNSTKSKEKVDVEKNETEQKINKVGQKKQELSENFNKEINQIDLENKNIQTEIQQGNEEIQNKIDVNKNKSEEDIKKHAADYENAKKVLEFYVNLIVTMKLAYDKMLSNEIKDQKQIEDFLAKIAEDKNMGVNSLTNASLVPVS
jgi:hypothetical protein